METILTRKKSFVKLFSATLTVLFFAQNAVFAYTPETNFWKERKKTSPTLLASLPQAPLGSILPLSPKALADLGIDSNLELSKKAAGVNAFIPEWMQSAIAPYARIHGVSLSKTKSPKTVLLVQDAHLHTEAQTNIAGVIERLGREIKNRESHLLVGMEGADVAELDFSRFNQFPYRKSLHMVAQAMLKANIINGIEYAAIGFMGDGTPKPVELPFRVTGVEDQTLYDQNVQALRESWPLKEKAAKALAVMKKELAELKKTHYTPELHEYDAKLSAYEEGTLSLPDYVLYLDSLTVATQPELKELIAAALLEGSIDFAQVEKERQAILQILIPKITQPESQRLMQMSALYQAGEVSYAAIYGYLKNLAERHGINFAKFPEMGLYIQYVLKSEGIDPQLVFEGLRNLQEKAGQNLFKTPAQAETLALTQQYFLRQKLSQYALTEEEWLAYEAQSVIPANDDLWTPFENFYRLAVDRNAVMATRMAERLNNSDTNLGLLVAGGFHTEGLVQQLKEQGFTVLTLSPKITKVEEGGPTSLSILASGHLPLDQLFTGERLFLNVPPASATNPTGFANTAIAGGEAVANLTEVTGEPLDQQDGSVASKLIGNEDVGRSPRANALPLGDEGHHVLAFEKVQPIPPRKPLFSPWLLPAAAILLAVGIQFALSFMNITLFDLNEWLPQFITITGESSSTKTAAMGTLGILAIAPHILRDLYLYLREKNKPVAESMETKIQLALYEAHNDAWRRSGVYERLEFNSEQLAYHDPDHFSEFDQKLIPVLRNAEHQVGPHDNAPDISLAQVLLDYRDVILKHGLNIVGEYSEIATILNRFEGVSIDFGSMVLPPELEKRANPTAQILPMLVAFAAIVGLGAAPLQDGSAALLAFGWFIWDAISYWGPPLLFVVLFEIPVWLVSGEKQNPKAIEDNTWGNLKTFHLWSLLAVLTVMASTVQAADNSGAAASSMNPVYALGFTILAVVAIAIGIVVLLNRRKYSRISREIRESAEKVFTNQESPKAGDVIPISEVGDEGPDSDFEIYVEGYDLDIGGASLDMDSGFEIVPIVEEEPEVSPEPEIVSPPANASIPSATSTPKNPFFQKVLGLRKALLDLGTSLPNVRRDDLVPFTDQASQALYPFTAITHSINIDDLRRTISEIQQIITGQLTGIGMAGNDQFVDQVKAKEHLVQQKLGELLAALNTGNPSDPSATPQVNPDASSGMGAISVYAAMVGTIAGVALAWNYPVLIQNLFSLGGLLNVGVPGVGVVFGLAVVGMAMTPSQIIWLGSIARRLRKPTIDRTKLAVEIKNLIKGDGEPATKTIMAIGFLLAFLAPSFPAGAGHLTNPPAVKAEIASPANGGLAMTPVSARPEFESVAAAVPPVNSKFLEGQFTAKINLPYSQENLNVNVESGQSFDEALRKALDNDPAAKTVIERSVPLSLGDVRYSLLYAELQKVISTLDLTSKNLGVFAVNNEKDVLALVAAYQLEPKGRFLILATRDQLRTQLTAAQESVPGAAQVLAAMERDGGKDNSSRSFVTVGEEGNEIKSMGLDEQLINLLNQLSAPERQVGQLSIFSTDSLGVDLSALAKNPALARLIPNVRIRLILLTPIQVEVGNGVGQKFTTFLVAAVGA